MADINSCKNLISKELRETLDIAKELWKKKNPNKTEQDFIEEFTKGELDKALKDLYNFQDNKLKINRLEEQFKVGNDFLKSKGEKELSIYEFLSNLLADRLQITGSEQNISLYYNITQARVTASNRIQDKIDFDILRKYNLKKKALSRDLESGKIIDNNVIRERARLNGDDIPSTGDNIAKEIAVILNKESKKTRDLMRKFGFDVGQDMPKYAGRQTHSKFLLTEAGFEKWYSDIYPLINFEESPFLQNRDFAKDLFKQLSEGVNLDKWALNAGDIKTKLAKDNFNQTREIHFKSTEDYIKYNDLYGTGQSQVVTTKNTLGNFEAKIPVKQVLGTAPDTTINYFLKKYSIKPSEKISILNMADDVLGRTLIPTDRLLTATNLASFRQLLNTLMLGDLLKNVVAFDKLTRVLREILYTGLDVKKTGKLLIAPVQGTARAFVYIARGLFNHPIGDKALKLQYSRGVDVGLNTISQGLRSSFLTNQIAEEVITKQKGLLKFVTKAGATQGFKDTAEVFGKALSRFGGLEALTAQSNYALFNDFGSEIANLLSKDFGKFNQFDKAFAERLGFDEIKFNVLKKIQIEERALSDDIIKGSGKVKVFEPQWVERLSNEDLLPLLQKEKAQEIKLNKERLKIKEEEINQLKNNKINEKDFETKLTRLEKEKEKLALKADLKYNKEAFDRLRYTLESDLNARYNEHIHKTLTLKNPIITSFQGERTAEGLVKGGTLKSELYNAYFQLKTYPILFWRNYVADFYYNSALKYDELTALGITFVVSEFVAGYMILQLNEIKKGNKPRELDGYAVADILRRSSIINFLAGMAGATSSVVADLIGKPIIESLLTQGNFDLQKEIANIPLLSKPEGLRKAVSRKIFAKPQNQAEANTKLIKEIKGLLPANNQFFIQMGLEFAINEWVLNEKEKANKKKELRKTKTAFSDNPRTSWY